MTAAETTLQEVLLRQRANYGRPVVADALPVCRAFGVKAPDGMQRYERNLLCEGDQMRGEAFVTLRDTSNVPKAIAFLREDGSHRWAPDSHWKGAYFGIGRAEGRILVTRSFHDGASLHETTGEGVAVVFELANLFYVCRALRARMQGQRIVICSEGDTESRDQAVRSARAVNGKVCFPEDASGFNALLREHGQAAVLNALAKARDGFAVEYKETKQ